MPDQPYRLLPASTAGAGIDAYRAGGGYAALREMLTSYTPAEALAQIRESGLRGRGGAGVLTAEKMALLARADAGAKYLVCNAYDADPRSLLSRTLLERSPHALLEGMALAAYVTGATEGFLYIRSGDEALAGRVRQALGEATEARTLGRGVLGSSFDFSITLVGVEMGFMGGEESTLLQILVGRPAKAQQRPPYPTDTGVFGAPTVVFNSETLANLPLILARSGATYRATGTQASPGTKLFTVLGADVAHLMEPGHGVVVEVPFGAPISEALRQAGLTVNETTARAVAVGGMEGGALPLSLLNTPLDFEPIEQAGAIIGSSVIEVLPAETDMVRWAMERSDYLSAATCGKCVPCRVGMKRIAGVLQGIVSLLGSQDDLALLEELGQYVPDGSLCGFGVNAVHPVRTAMRYFPDDFAAYLDGRRAETAIPVRAHRFVKKHAL